jgi:beta-carotene hydroxylase
VAYGVPRGAALAGGKMNLATHDKHGEYAAVDEAKLDLKVKPRLPNEYRQKSALWTALFLGYAVCAYILPAAAIYWVAAQSRWPLLCQIISVIFFGLVSQQGLHLLGIVGHEGLHFNLHDNRYLSAVLGIVFSAMVAGFLEIGMAISHWNHHRFTNQVGDPDVPLLTKYHTLWQRILFARVAANRQYFRNAVCVALGQPVDYATRFPFNDKGLQMFARFNIAVAVLWLSVYAWIVYHAPLAGTLAIVVPHFFASCSTGLRPYLEHAGTGTGLFQDTRTYISPFFSVMFFFNNYHLEHHLYPYVPCYRLPQVHRYLASRGYYAAARSSLDRGVLHNYAYATGRFQYPSAKPIR